MSDLGIALILAAYAGLTAGILWLCGAVKGGDA